jgi:thiol:disulfide interchange protein DsbD
MRVLRLVNLLSAVAWLLIFSGAARAQNPVTWAVKANAPATLKAGDKFTAQVTAQIAPGWHLYSITHGAGGPIPTRITIPDGQSFRLAGGVSGPRPRVEMDPNFQINTETHEGSATFHLPLVVAGDAPAGAQQLNINVRFQACDDTKCLPPRTVKLNAPVALAAAVAALPAPSASPTPASQSAKASPTPTPAAATTANSNNNTVQPLTSPTPAAATSTDAPVPAASMDPSGGDTAGTTTATKESLSGVNRESSLWSFLWLAITVGALSLLTPCVFPMVPITVSYFTNHAAGNRRAALRDAVIYSLGIILTFTALGVALAVLFGAAGINKFAANPWVNIVITLIFLSFAMSLFGAFKLQVPSSILTKLDALSRKEEGAAGSGGHVIALLLMGLTFSLTSFTCTAPFVGTLLVMAAQGDWIYPVTGMLAFSTVFALPFFVLALAPQLVSQLPKSGGWLNAVKVVMGLLEVAAAMKFLSNVDLVWRWGIFTREVVLASWVAVALLITFYLLGKFQLTHDMATERIGALRLMVSLIFLSLGFYLLTGLFGARLGELESFLPPATEGSAAAAFASSGGAATRTGELSWITNDYEGALKQARGQSKAMFIDFTGYTCTNCRWMEAKMFPRGAVRQELEKYVRVRLYTDGEGQPYEGFQQMQQEKFGTVALPLYAVLSGDGSILTTFAGLTRNEAEFVTFLKLGQAKFAPVIAGLAPRDR